MVNKTVQGKDLPLRSEIFSAEQMELHARRLAASHRISEKKPADHLLDRLDENQWLLVDVCKKLAQPEERQLIPGEEWLLDNFYLIAEQIRTARRHFPKDYSRVLPHLVTAPEATVPRVYDIALEVISHSDGRVDLDILNRFVASYQTMATLTLGELWAIPIMLRLALIENLRRVAARIAADRMHRHIASSWAGKMLEVVESDPKSLILVISDMARSNPPMASAFVAELARRLQGHVPASALPLTWIEQWLAESHTTIEQLVRLEAQQQAADQVSIGNSMASLRFLGAVDWREFVESASVVEQVLSSDPVNIYQAMDFRTRDEYRHVIETLARLSSLSERDVARHAIRLSTEALSRSNPQQGACREAHVGYFLVDKGLPLLERAVQARRKGLAAGLHDLPVFSTGLFLGVIAVFTAILTALLLWKLWLEGWHGGVLVPAGLVLLLCTSRLSVMLVSWLSTLLVASKALPRMDYSEGIPEADRTLVVVPAMLGSAAAIEHLCEAMEVRFLANQDSCLHFCLLTDFLDAGQQQCEGDTQLLAMMADRVVALNRKYQRDDLFFLLHRPRVWNPLENTWMGFERKRGKLSDLNAFLRGQARENFMRIVGNTAVLSSVRYVITLDTDTQLPRDAARELVSAMAHPLNRATFSGKDDKFPRIVAGYAILQPMVLTSIRGAQASRYAGLCGTAPGIDPYTRVVSDVYQNLFGEGSFIGKGIYEVDAFERALAGRITENAVLSHDLLEGCMARAGLLSDSRLYEEHPSQYLADVRRRHRWIRGDWQLLGWLLPAQGLSLLSRWKIADNLLRSLHSSAMLLLLVCGWLLSPAPAFWTAVAVAILLVPSLSALLVKLFQKQDDVLLRQHLAAVATECRNSLAQAGFTLACLPFDAFYSLDAVCRSLTRLLLTRRGLLEWQPSCQTSHDSINALANTVRRMWIAPVLSLLILATLVMLAPAALPVAACILLLWFFSPLLAWWLSQAAALRVSPLDQQQQAFLRQQARKTWEFFERFVTEQDHWLPPDNVQEFSGQPADDPVVAHRTSPTNIGLSLLANLAAHDFGYIPVGVLLTRSRDTLLSMAAMERCQGHFYNWYDTLSLQPLHPVYISTVDSGNLAGHLLVLRQGLLALPDQPVFSLRWLEGMHDTLAIVATLINANSHHDTSGRVHGIGLLADLLDRMRLATPASLPEQLEFADELLVSLTYFANSHGGESAGELGAWLDALVRQCQAVRDELRWAMPWWSMPPSFSCHRQFVDEMASTYNGSLPTLVELSLIDKTLQPFLARATAEASTVEELHCIASLRAYLAIAAHRATNRIESINRMSVDIQAFAQMQYDFLVDKPRHLLAIGYSVTERRRDNAFYDLLASESRMTSFVAIAQRQLAQDGWFALGRVQAGTAAGPVLLSWSGSMFEYLMPLLVMPEYPDTLLAQTSVAAVARHIAYGKLCGVPWGISESGYNLVDKQRNYQYHAFGVPGLGFRRGLVDDMVVAPYASMLALMVMPQAACSNLQRLAAMGMTGQYGFYEAIDFTPSRQRPGESSAIVSSFMAHHQGMSLLALAYALLDKPMQRRFEADLLLRGALLLLQERVPAPTADCVRTAELAELPVLPGNPEMPVRILNTADTPTPEVQLLSNGRYHLMVTNAGGGYSRWHDMAVTRWQEDSTCDHHGTFCYIRDVDTGNIWSTTHQPTLKKPDRYEVIFSEGRAEFRRSDYDIDTHTDIVVSPEDDIELRRMHITNKKATRRTIDITTYAEVVMADAASDNLHPAFSNLFVQTEIIRHRHAILCSRRARSTEEKTPYMLHLMVVHGADVQAVSYETDRRQFIGRTRSLADPAALHMAELSGSDGSVLDPVVAIRYRITLEPDQTAIIDAVSGVGETREQALALADKYQDRHLGDRVFDLAWTHSQVLLRQLNATETDAQLYGRLANSVLYANAQLRADASVLVRNRRGQSGLWAYGISGDLPIVLLQIHDVENIELVRQLVQAHAYWRLKGLVVDLLIWNEDRAGYRQVLQDKIIGLIGAGTESHLVDRPGGVFVRSSEQMPDEDRVLLQSVARVIIKDTRGTLAEQINRRSFTRVRVPLLVPESRVHRRDDRYALPPALPLVMDNGLGGFAADGREYVIHVKPGTATPAPWANVLANPHFGSVVSECGAAYTWSDNAHEFRLTPWYNDPVSDRSGEAFYLRDEETGHVWSPTPLPCPAASPYRCRHGFGYSVFECVEQGIYSELTVFVARDSAIKFWILKIRNETDRSRSLSATGYLEWALGDLRARTAQHIVTEIEPDTGALCARNAYSNEFCSAVSFFDVDARLHSFTSDRAEFIGRNGSQARPAAMAATRLSGKVGAGQDPCAAIQVPVELAAGQERELVFRLGVCHEASMVSRLVQRFRGVTLAHAELQSVKAYWQESLGAVQVSTPDAALDVLTNGWLLYQVIACRLWARSGYYQSGGAFGFRDQLQDTMALVHSEPQRLREQLLLCASRQFVEGDVQHWWHPPAGRGVRTRCSDDYLWLPLATCRYVLCTGDTGVLAETSHFLKGRAVGAEDDSYYDMPGHADETATLYQHCVLAIQHGLRFGAHGLPLIGSGDWNDGMNLVGIEGKGESIWLGFFLCEVLVQFSRLARLNGDETFADSCIAHSTTLRGNIEASGWDGGWYRRAYFDNGSPLGSARNDECRIDSISQSWSVFSGMSAMKSGLAWNEDHSIMAMDAVYERLVQQDEKLIRLLHPPFDHSDMNPGYIKGYVPGVRENGGQYTHGAIWAAMAYAGLGDSARAWELLRMINPVMHAVTAADVDVYKVEPYVMAADVYAVSPHIGRGGWSWYTGSAGWMYRLVIESLLGLQREGERLHIAPCLPAAWQGMTVQYRYHGTVYHIEYQQRVAAQAGIAVSVDGVDCAGSLVDLLDDGLPHVVQVNIRCEPVEV